MTITLIEVGPRDGLQNEDLWVATDLKIELINKLVASGINNIEVTSFVSPKSIPQLADNDTVFQSIKKEAGVNFSALVPNAQGMHNAIAAGVKNIALFTAASESFNQRNINCSIAESITRFKPVIVLAQQHNIHVRAYVSCTLGCPYEGEIKPALVAKVVEQLLDFQVDEISLGDTIGVGTVKQTKALVNMVKTILPLEKLAMHFHDTYGQAIANIVASLEAGVERFDSSVAGLGGCPYARGATGNVATEDVLYLLHGLGLQTGIDIYKVVEAGVMVCKALNRRNQSKVANALMASSGN